MKRSSLWYFLAMAIAFLKCWCTYLGLPMKDAGRITLLPDLISSGLLAVVTSSPILLYFSLLRVC